MHRHIVAEDVGPCFGQSDSQTPEQIDAKYHNSFSVGVDIETGGHVFQLQFTNSTGMFERSFITETEGQWGKGDIRYGFNISRVFTVAKPKKPKE